MSKIIGVDIGSKKLGLALLHYDGADMALLRTLSIKPSAGWPIERRLMFIDGALTHRFALPDHGAWGADVMAVEKPWDVVGHKDAFAAMWRTVGHCECMANRFAMDFHLVTVADWRRTSGVKGPTRKAFKRSAIQAAKVLLRKELPEDEAEAALVARHAALTIK